MERRTAAADSDGMPNFAVSVSSVTNGIWGRFLNQEEIKQSLSLLFYIAVSTITEQFATARGLGDKTPSQEYPMYNREQPESARASQTETSSEEYPAENHTKFVLTCLLSVRSQYLFCVISKGGLKVSNSLTLES